jgi:hypothetical protein
MLFYLLLFVQQGFAQTNSFSMTFGSNNSDFGYDIKAGFDKDFVLCGTSIVPWMVDDKGFFCIIDSLGNLKRMVVVSDTFNCISYTDVFTNDSGYIFLGYKQNHTFPFCAHFSIILTDKQLNMLNETLVKYSDTLKFSGMNGMIDYFNDFIFSGLNRDKDGSSRPYIAKISKSGQILQCINNHYTGFSSGYNHKVIEDYTNSGYYLGDQQKINGGYRILQVDSSLSLVSDMIALPNGMNQLLGMLKFQNNKLLIAARGALFGQYYLACLDTLGIVHFYKEYGSNLEYDVISKKSIDLFDNAIFIASFPGDLGELYFSQDDNKIFVQKMDTAFNVIWEKHIGWDAYFMQSAIKATPDGGCLVLGSVYDKDTMNQRHDVVVFKLDSNGNITGISNIGKMQTEVSVFPNPGHDHFMLEATRAMQAIKIYDQQGLRVKNLSLTGGTNRIDMDDIPSGIYFIQVISGSGDAMSIKKWVKGR